MRRYVLGGVVAALLLTMTAVFGSRPFNQPLQNQQRISSDPGSQNPRIMNNKNRDIRAQVTGPQSRAQIAAQDMAITTALCVRDCRFALQHLANQLEHAADQNQKQQLIRNAMKEHPQFRAMMLQTADGQTFSHGSAAKPQYLKESVNGLKKSGQFYVSDLYEGHGGKDQLLMSLAVPVLNGSQIASVLAAEVQMGFLRSVADQVDNQMGTITQLNTQDGDRILFHPEKSHSSSGQPVTQAVDGTKWNTSSVQVRSKSEDIRTISKRNEVVVQFDREPDAATLSRIQKEIDGVIVRRNTMPTFVFRSNTKSTDQLIAYFQKMGVRMVEPNRILRQNELPNDRLYQKYQWNFPQIKIENAWQATTGIPSTIIAVVDTGIDLDHPEFAGQLVEGHNMIADDNRPVDDNGHGTHVAGVIIARTNNVEGVAGMNWNSRVMPVKALDAEGTGTVFDIADGVRWAADHGAKVINLSLGEYEDSRYLHQAIQYAVSKDALVVAAMGNDDTDQPSYPAAYPEVLAVTAVDQDTKRATFSNYGSHAGVAAPGVSIASTFPDYRYAAMSGTSMASPHVAGLAGLIRSMNPDLSSAQVRDIILRTATDVGPSGPDPYYGRGLINVTEAVRQAQIKSQEMAPPEGRRTPVRRDPWWWPFRRLFGFEQTK
ncbi:S8 family serine peptidase [Effusibacillus lacus]|uniref:Peptidase S8 n=1 Tax=Effusibacillus lacus TaxID=1348429 RepID=A0A292YMQ3_9BACL|nr:S8 family serine peptidase [Effusibacillus lacus]TCS76511.1 subtilase family protein [Effusibacillus lacus]GAX90466.1 peptidase S8 [Effusibacillus lacus]